MVPYLIMYLLFVAWWIVDLTRDQGLKWVISVLMLFAILIFVGLRYEVGGDWGDYLMWYKKIELEGASQFEPAYNFS